MDAKTLSKMTVSKLRDEAMKFDDLVGVHGMEKPELIEILKAEIRDRRGTSRKQIPH